MEAKRGAGADHQGQVPAPATTPAAPVAPLALAGGAGFAAAEVLSLQATAGNAAVCRAIRSGSVAPPASRTLARNNVITVDPVFIGDRQEERQAISNEAIRRLTDTARDYATLWLVATQGALMEAPEPEDPSARRNYYRALAGNMVWAATSLFATWNPLVIPMSFGGAAVGSGALAEDAYPSGKPALVPLLTQARDRMAAGARDVAREIGGRCGRELISDAERQRQMLWELIFPGAPFESSDALRAASLTLLTRLLEVFRAQYEAWRRSCEAEATRRQESYARSLSPAGAPPSALNRPRNFLEEVMRERPFNPSLPAVGAPSSDPGKTPAPAPAPPDAPPAQAPAGSPH